MNKSKKLIYLSLTIVSAISLASVLIFNTQSSSATVLTENKIDFSITGIQDEPISVKKGETLVIPVSIMSPAESALKIKMGITSDGQEGFFAITGQQKLPTGITATLSKNSEDLSSGTGSGIQVRDKVNLTITADQTAKDGSYPLSFVMSLDKGNGEYNLSKKYFTINISG